MSSVYRALLLWKMPKCVFIHFFQANPSPGHCWTRACPRSRCPFHQHLMSSFCACRSKKCKKTRRLDYLYALLESALVKDSRKHVGEIYPRCLPTASSSSPPILLSDFTDTIHTPERSVLTFHSQSGFCFDGPLLSLTGKISTFRHIYGGLA